MACLAVVTTVMGGCATSNVLAPVGRAEDEWSGAPKPSESRGEARPSVPAPAPAPSAPPGVHVVKRGDTLYSIAWRYGLDHRRIALWNTIVPPYVIYPGQHLRTTPPAAGEPVREAAPAPTQPLPAAAQPPSAPSASAPAAAQPGATVPASRGDRWDQLTEVGTWQWPTKGKVIGSFSASGRKGIDIVGSLGQSVHAAADGRIVYSGGGLIGYGELIIIKHSQRYLSAYAHNNKRLVEEGDEVSRGDAIAEMGRSGTDRVMLHFEIRRDGKPVDPAHLLPK